MQDDGSDGHFFLSNSVVWFENRNPTLEQVHRLHEALKQAAKSVGFEFQFLLFEDNDRAVARLLKLKERQLKKGAPLGVTFRDMEP